MWRHQQFDITPPSDKFLTKNKEIPGRKNFQAYGRMTHSYWAHTFNSQYFPIVLPTKSYFFHDFYIYFFLNKRIIFYLIYVKAAERCE